MTRAAHRLHRYPRWPALLLPATPGFRVTTGPENGSRTSRPY